MSSPHVPPSASPDEKLAIDEKHAIDDNRHHDLEAGAPGTPSGRARWFGGPNIYVGRRIGPVLSSLSSDYQSESDDSSSAILLKQKEIEANSSIQYRTCTWQKV